MKGSSPGRGFCARKVVFYVGNREARSPLIPPHYGDMTGEPRRLIHSGENELPSSDAQRFADNVLHILAPTLPEMMQAADAIGGSVQGHLIENSVAAEKS